MPSEPLRSTVATAPELDSKQVFRLLVDSVADYAIFLLDPAGYISSWNSGAERLNGYSRQEAIGKHFSIFYTPLDLAADKPIVELRIAAKEGNFQGDGQIPVENYFPSALPDYFTSPALIAGSSESML